MSDTTEESGESGWRDRFQRVSAWPGELTEEALALPATLKSLRQTITDLQQVAARLDAVTGAMEALLETAEASGLGPLARRIEAAAQEVERQVDAVQTQLPGPNLLPVHELRKTVEAFTSLIPKPKGEDSAE